MVMLLTMSGSLIMIAVWSARYRHTGHVLPAAGRGILRVPVPVMLAGLVLGVLISLMVLAGGGGVPEVGPPQGASEVADSGKSDAIPAPAADPLIPAQSVTDKDPDTGSQEAVDVPADGPTDPEQQNTAAPAAAPALSRQQLLVSMTSTLTFDLLLLCLFGGAVLAFSHRGRVRLNDHGPVMVAVIPENREERLPEIPRPAETALRVEHRWPDLDQPLAALSFPATFPATSIAGGETAAEPSRQDPPNRPPLSAGPVTADSDGMPPDERLQGELSRPQADLSVADLSVPEEPFAFLTELRFAAEVFLAAWLPTAILRLITVFLSYTLTGEQPGSHPFLEVMRDGIDWQVFALITFLAVILAPLFEELLYRVVILGGIVQADQLLAGWSVSSVVFCLAHGFPDSLALLPLAFALGYTYLRRRSYVTVMLVHFLFNGFNMMIAALSLL